MTEPCKPNVPGFLKYQFGACSLPAYENSKIPKTDYNAQSVAVKMESYQERQRKAMEP